MEETITVKELETIILNIVSNISSNDFTIEDPISLTKNSNIILNIGAIKAYTVTYNLSNIIIEYDTPQKTWYGENEYISVYLYAKPGYTLPSTISLSNAQLINYNSITGLTKFRIDGTGNVILTATAVADTPMPSTYTVTYSFINITYTITENNKSSYNTGEIVKIKLTANSGYTLPSSVSLSNATQISYSSSTGILEFKIGSGNVQITAQAISNSGTDEPDMTIFNSFLQDLSSVITINSSKTTTYNYLKELYIEAYHQFYNKQSVNNIPKLLDIDNFPYISNYYSNNGNSTSAFKTLIGWLLSLQVSEINPRPNRKTILKYGYEFGGYNKSSKIYEYKFEYDPNVNRIVAGMLYAAMRGIKKPNISSMRSEIGGSLYGKTLAVIDGPNDSGGEPGLTVDDDKFFIDLTQFMPYGPGPYNSNGQSTTISDTKATLTEISPYTASTNLNSTPLKYDFDIYKTIVSNYNLNNSAYKQTVVQAIADKEGMPQHLFGITKNTRNYTFEPVFGESSIGKTISTSGHIANLGVLAWSIASTGRKILMNGRLRPGSRWTYVNSSTIVDEPSKHSSESGNTTHDALYNGEIEENDGYGYGAYDINGNWNTNSQYANETAYIEDQTLLYSTSYPSGHSAGIMSCAMILAELMPDKADKLLKRANQYAINRIICRYHWMSDTIMGRVLGTAVNVIIHTANDYDTLLNNCVNELNNSNNNNNGQIIDAIITPPGDPWTDYKDEYVNTNCKGIYNSADGGLSSSSHGVTTIGYIINIPADYGTPFIKGIIIKEGNGSCMFESCNDIYIEETTNIPSTYTIDSSKKHYNIIASRILANTSGVIRRVRVYCEFNNGKYGYVNLYQKA